MSVIRPLVVTWVVAVALLASEAQSTFAQTKARPTFEFRGIRLNDTLPQSLSQHCFGDDDIPDDRGFVCSQIEQSIGGVAVSIDYYFVDSHLRSVSLQFSPDEFDDLITALSAKYGKPSDLQTERYRTRGGVRYQNIIASWSFRVGTFTVSKYGSRADIGSASIYEPRLLVRWNELRQRAIRAAAIKDLSASRLQAPPPAAAPPLEPFEVSTIAMLLSPIPIPAPPAGLRSADVLFEFVIGADGKIELSTVRTTLDDQYLDAGKAALKDLRYAPAQLNGERVRQNGRLRIHFQ